MWLGSALWDSCCTAFRQPLDRGADVPEPADTPRKDSASYRAGRRELLHCPRCHPQKTRGFRPRQHFLPKWPRRRVLAMQGRFKRGPGSSVFELAD